MFEFVFECSSVVSISLDGILSTLGCWAQGELGINPEDDPVWMLGMVGVRFDHFSIYYINLLVNNIL